MRMLSQAYDLALILYYTESLDVWGEQARVRPNREKETACLSNLLEKW